MTSLRGWQVRALGRMDTWSSGSFLLNAAPGAGKTIPSLTLAKRLIAQGAVQRIAVVCPTSPLTRQWAQAAGRLGLHLAPDAPDLRPPHDFQGVAVTYARVSSAPEAFRKTCTPGAQAEPAAGRGQRLGQRPGRRPAGAGRDDRAARAVDRPAVRRDPRR